MLAFYTEVLGMELRSDQERQSDGSRGALVVPDGTAFRQSTVYARGARHGHLLFVDLRDGALPNPGIAPRPPNRGLVAWTFPVRDVHEILAGSRPPAPRSWPGRSSTGARAWANTGR